MDTSYLSLSSEEANGIMGKTSRIIKKNIVINSVKRKRTFARPSDGTPEWRTLPIPAHLAEKGEE